VDLQKENKNPPWNWKEALLALVMVYLINIVASLIIGFLNISPSGFGGFTLASLVQTAAIVGVVYYYVVYKHHSSEEALGLDSEKAGRYLVTGIGGGIAVFLAVIASSLLVQRIFSVTGELQPFAQLVVQTENFPQLLLLFFLGVVLVPFGEELYFRGFLYPALRSSLGVPLAILGSALVFGFPHLDLLRLIPLAIGGAGLAWLYEKTGSLYVSFVAHGFWNLVMLGLLIISRYK